MPRELHTNTSTLSDGAGKVKLRADVVDSI